MAIDPQDRKRVDETGQYVKDTLRGVAAELADLFKTAAQNATDPIAASNIKQTAKDFVNELNKGARAASKIQDFTDKFSEGLLSSSELQKRSLEIQRESNRVNSEAASIATQILEDTTLTTDERETLLKRLKESTFNAQQALKVEENQLETLQTRVKEVEKLTGATGRLLKAVKAFPGLGSLIDAKSIEAQLNKYAAADKNRMQVFFKGLSLISGQVIKNLFSLEAIVGRIAKAFFEVDKALVNVRRLSGEISSNFASLNSSLASTVDVLQQIESFTKQTGLAATAVFTEQDLGRIAEAKNLLGLTAEQANKLSLFSKVSSTSIDNFDKYLVQGVSAANKFNKSVVAPGVALQDVLNASDDIALSLGGSPTALGRAATAARALGLELSRVNSIADGLMDFESSIQAELEAQLLTGKQINLGRARELALANDLEGVAKELSKNGASAAEFSEMNRIQQTSLAKALGLSREELAKSIIAQDTQNKLTDEQRRKILGVTAEQMRSMSIQEKMNKLVSKLAQAFSPVLEILYPIVDVIGSVATELSSLIAKAMQVSKSLLGAFGPPALGVIALFSRSLISLPFKLLGKGFSMVSGAVAKFSGRLVTGVAKLFGYSTAQTAAATSTTAMGTATKTSGKFIGSFFRSLSSGLMALANPAALLGLGAVTLAIIGIGAALRLAAPAIKAFGTVISAAFTGIVGLVTAVFEGFKSLLGEITPQKLLGLYALGPALIASAAGLTAFSFALAGAGISNLIGGGIIDSVKELAATADPLAKVGTSLTVVAAGIASIASALATLETEKLNEIKDLVITTAFAAPAVAATGAITDLIAGITGTTAEQTDNKALLTKIDELINVVRQGGNVYIDGNRVGESLMLASTKLS